MTQWRPIELIRWTTDYLTSKGIDEPRLNSELLLSDALGCKRLDLYLQFERPLTAEELADFKSRLLRRLKHEPLQYIAGAAAFRELTLLVDRRVLIPRPETELLVGEVLAWAAGRPGLDVVDIGTGSGAIALSLRHEGTFGRVVATDISEEALAVARLNFERGPMCSEVEFRHGAGFLPIRGDRFDVIVSNPPYIAETDRESLPPEVVQWEPATALFAGDDGLRIIRDLILRAPDHLRSGGLLALEIGADQATAVAEMVRQHPSYGTPAIRSDLSGRARMLLVEKVL